jgi:hypothetical protein
MDKLHLKPGILPNMRTTQLGPRVRQRICLDSGTLSGLPRPSASQAVIIAAPLIEMQRCDLADLLLAPSSFRRTPFVTLSDRIDHHCALRFGFDRVAQEQPGRLGMLPGSAPPQRGLRFWRLASLKRARSQLVGPWPLAETKKKEQPRGYPWQGQWWSEQLRIFYLQADIFVFRA